MTTKGEPADIRLVIRDLVNLATGALLALTVFNASTVALVPVAVAAVAVGLAYTKRLTGADLAFIALAVLAWLSLMWTQAPLYSQGAALTQLGCLGVFLLVRGTVTHPRALILACLGYLVGCGVAARTVRERLGGFIVGGGDRVALDGLNANYLAYAMAAGLVVCMFWWQLRPGLFGRTLVAGAVVVLFAGIAMTGTRAAMVAAGALIAWLVVARISKGRAPLKILVVAVICVGVGIATGAINSVVARFVVQSDRENGSLNNRLPTWERAVDVFLEHPILGAGVGSFRGLNDLGIVAHNGFLEIASGLGVAGLGLLVYVLYRVLLVETRDLPRRAVLVGAVLAVTAPCFLSGNWVQSPAMWAVLALLTRLSTALPANDEAAPTNLERGQQGRTTRQPVSGSNAI